MLAGDAPEDDADERGLGVGGVPGLTVNPGDRVEPSLRGEVGRDGRGSRGQGFEARRERPSVEMAPIAGIDPPGPRGVGLLDVEEGELQCLRPLGQGRGRQLASRPAPADNQIIGHRGSRSLGVGWSPMPSARILDETKPGRDLSQGRDVAVAHPGPADQAGHVDRRQAHRPGDRLRGGDAMVVEG